MGRLSKGCNKILVVDDQESIRKSLFQLLTNEGYEVDTAESGEKALEKLEKKEFNLILINIRMPGIDGIELLEKVRAKHYKAIIITGYATLDQERACLNLGAKGIFRKPYDIHELLASIKRVLEEQKLECD